MAIGWFFFGAVGILPAALSVMLFDTPGSDERPEAILLFWCLFSFPVVCIASAVRALRFRRADQFQKAYWALALPVLNIVIGAAVVGWIELIHGGKSRG